MLDDQARSKLRQLDDKRRDRLGPSGVVGIEFFVAELTKDFVSELGVVVGIGEDVEEFGHGFGEMFKVGKVLHDGYLSGCKRWVSWKELR